MHRMGPVGVCLRKGLSLSCYNAVVIDLERSADQAYSLRKGSV